MEVLQTSALPLGYGTGFRVESLPDLAGTSRGSARPLSAFEHNQVGWCERGTSTRFPEMRISSGFGVLLLAIGGCGGTQTQSYGPAPAPQAQPPVEEARAPLPQATSDWPPTRRDDVVDTVHGVTIADPYRWLEKVEDPAVQEWMAAQNAVTRKKIDALPARAALRDRFKELLYLDSVSAPVHEGKRWFYTRSHADKEKAIVYYRDGEKGAEKVLLDPNTLSPDGSISLGGWYPAQNGRYVAYRLKKNAADAATLYVRDLETGKDLEKDVIEGARYAYAAWTPDSKGFYYTALPVDPSIAVDQLPGKAHIRYHVVGTDPKTDAVIHPATNNPTKFLGVGLSRDGRYLFVEISGYTRTEVFFKDLKAKQKDLAPLTSGKDFLYNVYAWKGKLYVYTNEGAPRWRLFQVDPKKPQRDAWKEIVAERADATLDGVHVIGNHLVLEYLKNATSELEIHALDGKLVRKVELPGLGSMSGVVGREDEDDTYFGFVSFTQTPQIFRTSVKTGKTSLWEEVKVPIDMSPYTTEQVWYKSKDGTRVSMFLVRRKDLERNGDNPTLLTGYGGFNVSRTPTFGASYAVFLEHGGVVAMPNLRGGGEYGEDWHRGGSLANKQNVFDDFISAAEWLVAEKITRPERLAISGGSNGGLLVGAAMTQRPDLFRAVMCSAPLLDMVRYHLFGSGRTWIDEYGSAEDPELFKVLHAYSPYHRVKDGTSYPALLMLSPDSDDRVDPLHARKFVAAIQHATASKRPVLFRIEKNAGHGGADLRRQKVEESADGFAFIMEELGMK
jgi:prolyl oligopeptidase